jgi:hypothetical protein
MSCRLYVLNYFANHSREPNNYISDLEENIVEEITDTLKEAENNWIDGYCFNIAFNNLSLRRNITIASEQLQILGLHAQHSWALRKERPFTRHTCFDVDPQFFQQPHQKVAASYNKLLALKIYANLNCRRMATKKKAMNQCMSATSISYSIFT